MGNHYHLMVRFEAFRQLSKEELEERARHFYPKLEQTAHWTQLHWERFNRRLLDVSELMRNIQMVYAKWHNRRFGRRGSFWEGRFKSTLLIDLNAVQECLLYAELNPVRAGLAERPEQWSRSSAHLRNLKEDHWMLPLEEIFPGVSLREVDQHYRARLFYRGAIPKEPGGKVIPQQVIREEESRAFCRQGLYLERLRYFTDGLVVEARRVFGSGLLGSGVRAGIYADATPSFTEDLLAFGSNARLFCALPLEGNVPSRSALSTHRGAALPQ